jgi:hypothetical protein
MDAMIGIATSQTAIVKALPLGSVAFEGEPDAKGQRMIWLEGRPTGQAQRHARQRPEPE